MDDLIERLRQPAVFAEPAESQRCHLVMAEAADALEAQQVRIAQLEDDVRIWRREAADRSEGMVALNLDRAAMGVENMRLREALQAALDTHGTQYSWGSAARAALRGEG